MLPLDRQLHKRHHSQIYLWRPFYLPFSYYWGWESHVNDRFSIDAEHHYLFPGFIFIYTLAGAGRLAWRNTCYALTPGAGCFMRVPGLKVFSLPDASPMWEFLMVHVVPAVETMNMIADLSDKLFARRDPLLPLGDAHPVVAQACRFIAHAAALPAGFRDAQQLAEETALLLYAISREVEEAQTLPHGVIFEALTLMKTRLNEPHTLASLAYTLHLSPSHFSHLFRQHVGIPPMQYLTKLRLEQAVLLLIQTNVTVITIAKYCGFPNYATLEQALKRTLGLTPQAIRAGRTYPTRRQLWGDHIEHELLHSYLPEPSSDGPFAQGETLGDQ